MGDGSEPHGSLARILQGSFNPLRANGVYKSAEALAKLQQVGSIQKYQTEFEKQATQASSLSEPFLISCFIGGLKEEIHLNVKKFRPTCLTSTVGLTPLQEERQTHKPQSKNSTKFTTGPVSPVAQKIPLVKRLNLAEAVKRRHKNLYYKCDERWEARHKCKQKILFLIEGDDADVFKDA
jgi:hypothetical protein